MVISYTNTTRQVDALTEVYKRYTILAMVAD